MRVVCHTCHHSLALVGRRFSFFAVIVVLGCSNTDALNFHELVNYYYVQLFNYQRIISHNEEKILFVAIQKVGIFDFGVFNFPVCFNLKVRLIS